MDNLIELQKILAQSYTFHQEDYFLRKKRANTRFFLQRVEKVSARWETSKKVGIFFVLAFVGVRGYARVRERKKQASTRLSRRKPCTYLFTDVFFFSLISYLFLLSRLR